MSATPSITPKMRKILPRIAAHGELGLAAWSDCGINSHFGRTSIWTGLERRGLITKDGALTEAGEAAARCCAKATP